MSKQDGAGRSLRIRCCQCNVINLRSCCDVRPKYNPSTPTVMRRVDKARTKFEHRAQIARRPRAHQFALPKHGCADHSFDAALQFVYNVTTEDNYPSFMVAATAVGIVSKISEEPH